MEDKDIVERMARIRKFLGLTQSELADALRYSLFTVKKIESGTRGLSTAYFRAFCLRLGVSADYLLDGEIRVNGG